MRQLLIDLHYFPSIAYFTALYYADEVLIDCSEKFGKRSYRNRCSIISANKPLDLSVPVHGANRKLPVERMEIDYHEKWVNNHWRAIQSAYGKAPFFDFYSEIFKEELYAEPARLVDLNRSLLSICLKFLKIGTKVSFIHSKSDLPQDGLWDLREQIHPRNPIEKLDWFVSIPYQQIFGKNFVPNMSILDLLFCCGPEAIMVLKQSGTNLANN